MAVGEPHLIVSVPVPLVDSMLPHLKDTELRVLLILMRQLRVVGRERNTVWLTHRELCRRTGRASEAVSAAIAHLSTSGLLSVHDETGQILESAAARQHGIGRRHFHLSELAFPLADGMQAAKSKTIENKEDIYSFRFSEPPLRFSEDKPSQDALLQLGSGQSDPLTQERITEEKRRIRETLTGIRATGRATRNALTHRAPSGTPGARPVVDNRS